LSFVSEILLKGKSLIEGFDKNYDFKLTTGIYYMDDIKSKDLCTVLQKIKENKDARIDRKISVMKAVLKYKNLRKYSSCLGI